MLHPAFRIVNSEPASFEGIAKADEFGGEPLLLADVLSNDQEDPATKAARKIDWDCFVAGLSERCRTVVEAIAAGGMLKEAAVKLGRSQSWMPRIRDQIADQARQFFGAAILSEIVKRPGWNDCLVAGRQLAACRCESQPA